MTDLSDTLAPKSDQLTADDLIAGPITIRITDVVRGESPAQPIAIRFDGDNGKPYRPGLSMRRMLAYAWGPDGGSYKGRSLTLYRDPAVVFGGLAVGGIRISHMSHIDSEMALALTETKGKKKPHRVWPLVEQPPADPAQEVATDLIRRFDAAPDGPALFALIDDPRIKARRDRLKETRPELWQDVEAAVMAANQRVGSVPA